MITIVGLGIRSGDLTLNAVEALCSGIPVLLRTERTPAVAYLKKKGIPYTSLDYVYNQTEDFDEVNTAITKAVLYKAEQGDVVFGVIGGAGLLDASVCEIASGAKEKKIPLQLIPGVGEYEYAAAACGGLEHAAIVAAIDLDDMIIDVRRPLILCQLNDRITASDCKLKLLESYPADWPVCLYGETIPLEELDRLESYDHLTCAVLRSLPTDNAERFDLYHVFEQVEQGRRTGKAIYSEEQITEKLSEHFFEALHACRNKDAFVLSEALGGMLLQMVYLVLIYTERTEMEWGDVTTAAFDELMALCTRQGRDSIDRTGMLQNVPPSLSALMRADCIQRLAREVGFDWEDPQDALAKVKEETEEVYETFEDSEKLPGELGDLLFAVVNVCRMKGIEPEMALEETNRKFIRRFSYIEKCAKEAGRDLTEMSLEEMDALWNKAKTMEKHNPSFR